ncbi:hypothetical protein WKU26_06580 [Phocaeicola sp. HCN-40430]|jgi:mannose-6-phosphate isomerase-like protein (cupin superfamily)|uniref:hypothetical protein n=1 Tax=Phocaeicola sp. HCN-40430 TaxID=3134664 RepID=UPI0030C61DC3
MKQIDTYTYTGKGYNPFLIDKDWQIAQLNFEEGQGFHDLKKIDKHLFTDEAFILKKGVAVLISATLDNENVEFEVIKMKEGIVYNIPKGVWHNIALSTDAEVFIVENSNTHLSDFEYYYLSEKTIQRLNSLIDSVCNCV